MTTEKDTGGECGCNLSDAEATRITELRQLNLKILGKKYARAAEDMAIFQVSMEHAAKHEVSKTWLAEKRRREKTK